MESFPNGVFFWIRIREKKVRVKKKKKKPNKREGEEKKNLQKINFFLMMG